MTSSTDDIFAGVLGWSVSLELPAMERIDLDGPVAYRVWDGPPETTFVMVHGLGGAHINWIRVAPGLSGLGRVVALDLPGFGWSPRAGRTCALDGSPTDALALRRRAGHGQGRAVRELDGRRDLHPASGRRARIA